MHDSGHGEAGRTGPDVRSDLRATLELKDSGGIQVHLASKVAALYGAAIQRDAEKVLRTLGVENARVYLNDHGAVPFVIAARIEAAARRAGVQGGDARPARTRPDTPPTPRDRLRRSRLYLPGSEPKFFFNAGLHKPDGIILDLEDSVHPTEKDAARLLVRNALRCVDFQGAERMVRINQLPVGLEDLEELVPENPDLILIPKTERADQVTEVASRIATLQEGSGKSREIWLMPILESALGVENAFDIATAHDSVVALTVGLEDYTADMGVRKTVEGTESFFARARLVNAAKAAGVQAIDSVFGDVGDMDGLHSWTIRSRALGFEGMGCVHPRQIQVIHRAFAPSAHEVEKAQSIVSAFEDATARGLGVVSLGSKMIDPPVVLQAQRLVRLAQMTGVLPDTEEEPEDRNTPAAEDGS